MPTEVPRAIEQLVRAAAAADVQPAEWLGVMTTATGVAPAAASADGRLTLGLPGLAKGSSRRLANHLFWWPAGLPAEKLVGVVSSRLSRKLEHWSAWFLGLRALCAAVDSEQERLVIATETTTGRFAARSAELFGVPTLRLEVASGGTLESWWKTVADPDGLSEQDQQLFVSPPIARRPTALRFAMW